MSTIEFPSTEDEKSFIESVIKTTEGYYRSMANTNDIELLVLRTHLWIERLLEEIIQLSFPNPESILDARFSFSNKLSVVKAIVGDSQSRLETCNKMNRINRIRNEMAHKIDSNKLPELFLKVGMEYRVDSDGLFDNALFEKIMLDFATIYGEFVGIKESLRLSNEGIKVRVISE